MNHKEGKSAELKDRKPNKKLTVNYQTIVIQEMEEIETPMRGSPTGNMNAINYKTMVGSFNAKVGKPTEGMINQATDNRRTNSFITTNERRSSGAGPSGKTESKPLSDL